MVHAEHDHERPIFLRHEIFRIMNKANWRDKK